MVSCRIYGDAETVERRSGVAVCCENGLAFFPICSRHSDATTAPAPPRPIAGNVSQSIGRSEGIDVDWS